MSQPTPVPASAPEATPDKASTHRAPAHAAPRPRVAVGDRDLSIAVIGGSLVGPATELFLRRAGFTDVTTYEAMPRAHCKAAASWAARAHRRAAGVDRPGPRPDRRAARQRGQRLRRRRRPRRRTRHLDVPGPGHLVGCPVRGAVAAGRGGARAPACPSVRGRGPLRVGFRQRVPAGGGREPGRRLAYNG